MKRLRAWLAYCRRLSALLGAEEAAGYDISPARYERLRELARQEAAAHPAS